MNITAAEPTYEDLGDRENIGNASVSAARNRKKTTEFKYTTDSPLCGNCQRSRAEHVFFIFCPPEEK